MTGTKKPDFSTAWSRQIQDWERSSDCSRSLALNDCSRYYTYLDLLGLQKLNLQGRIPEDQVCVHKVPIPSWRCVGHQIQLRLIGGRAQLLHLRPDLEIVPIRGNVPTRVDKVRSEGLHAVVLAEAGLVRLGLGAHISFVLSTAEVLPAPGQGALAIECRRGDERVWAALRPLHDEQVAATTQAERTLLRTLRGGCHAPVGAYAQVQGESLRLEACVAAPDGRDLCRATQSGPPTEAEALGRELADQLLAEGVGVWLEESRL